MILKLITKIAKNKSTNIKDQRSSLGFYSSIIGIIINVLLFAIKLIVGVITNSISLIADSINNLSDSATGIVGIVGFKMSTKPADKEHPFGHGRTEYISSLVVSFIILVIGYELIKDSLGRIINPAPIKVNLIVMILLSTTILSKLWLSRFYKKVGNDIQSQVLKTASVDSLNDVWATASVLIAFIVYYYSDLVIDGYMGVIVALLIMFNGITFIKGSLDTIIGDKPEVTLIEKLKDYILNFDGILNIHDLIIHDYGPMSKMATAHVEISSTLSLLVAHEIIDRIEEGVKMDFDISLLLHMDPIETDCIVTNDIRDKVINIIHPLPGVKSIVDFRVIEEEINYTVFFQINIHEEFEEDIKIYKYKVIKILESNFKYKFIINIKKENLYVY